MSSVPFEVNFSPRTTIKAGVPLVVCIDESGRLLNRKSQLSASIRKGITAVLESSRTFAGKDGQTLVLHGLDKTLGAPIFLVGVGNAKKLAEKSLENIGGRIAGFLKSEKYDRVQLLAGGALATGTLAAAVAYGARLGLYKFDKYKAASPDAVQPKKISLTILGTGAKVARAYEAYAGMADGVVLARDFVNEPPNFLNPVSFARSIQEELSPLGVQVTILDVGTIHRLGMGGLANVGGGSKTPPALVIMEWAGTGGKKRRPVSLVGKGITFDTGGLSIKPSQAMPEMISDMAGAAAVVGAMAAIAKRKVSIPVVAAVALAENAVDSNSYRPSDIITIHGGKTVEVLNTDAEGRLVLADALVYVQKTYDPEAIVDIATLTGAARVALGTDFAAAYANTDELWARLDTVSGTSGDRLWRMPLDASFRKQMESEVADLKNIAGWHGLGGSCTAAAFLEHFIDAGRTWGHLDIAGTALAAKSEPTCPKGPTGFGVRLLTEWVENYAAPVKRTVKRTAAKKAAAPKVAGRGRGRPRKEA